MLIIGIGGLIGILLMLSSGWIWRQQLNRSSADLLIRGLADPDVPPDIVIVGIDDASLNSTTGFGRLTEWDRGLYARLLEQLNTAQARVVVFDILFSGQAIKGDAEFASALKRYPNTVMAVAQSNVNAEIELPTQALLDVSKHFGHVNLTIDTDGVLRRIPLYIQNYPTLGLAGLNLWWNLPADAKPTIQDDLVTLPNGLTLPVNDGEMLIRFAAMSRSFPVYSFRDVVNGTVDPAVFKDKMVLVGSTAIALSDHHNTPVAAVMDGVKLHANVIASILSGAQLREQSAKTNLIVIGLITAILLLIALQLRPTLLLASMLIGIVLVPLVGMYMFLWHDLRINMTDPTLTIVFVGLTCLAIQNAVQKKEYQQVYELFSRRTPPTVIDQLLQEARNGTLKLGGERREVSVLFIDMRGFTSIAERLLPEDLMRTINIYLDIIASTLINHGGTVNQYAGDQAMAIFNAPLPQPDHAKRAIEAGQAALEAINTFNSSAAAQALPARAQFGVGVNTGIGIVGNVGAHERYDYSVIGDVTNVAARLCGAAPANMVYIGPDTMLEDLSELEFDIQPVGPLAVKGKERPLEVYSVYVPMKGDNE